MDMLMAAVCSIMFLIICSFPDCAGVKLSDASKKLGKKFATGASVVKVLCHGLSCYSTFLF
jgi:hypothetical protein